MDPTRASRERLAILAEEMGEALQVIGKILRHGWESTNPDGNPEITNRVLLEFEMGDVLAAMRLLTAAGDMRADFVVMREVSKLRKMQRNEAYLRLQPRELLDQIILPPATAEAQKQDWIVEPGLPTGDRSHVERVFRQPVGLPGAGKIIAEMHRFFWKTGSKLADLDSRRLKMDFGSPGPNGGWLETRYRRGGPGEPFERVD